MGSTVGCVDCKLKFPTCRTTKNMLREMDHSLLPLDAQCHAAEEELGQRSRGSSPPRPTSLEQPVVGSLVQVRRSGAGAPPLTVSARAGGTSCGGLLGPITQPAASGGVYSQHMQTLVTALKRSTA